MRPPYLIILAALAGYVCSSAQIDAISPWVNSDLVKAMKGGGGGRRVGKESPSDWLSKAPGGASDGVIDPNEYVLGPGDILSIYLGMGTQCQVNPEGYISIPDIPQVKVGDLTLKEARPTIMRTIAKSYDSNKVQISLNYAAPFKVYILGGMLLPGPKTLPPFSRLDAILEASGGFSSFAIRDSILIVHATGDSVWADLSRFFIDGDMKNNPRLKIGDHIVVGTVDTHSPYCLVKGEGVSIILPQRPSTHLESIARQVAGYISNIRPQQCRVLRKGAPVRLVAETEFRNFLVEDGDTLELLTKSDLVFVGGAVAKPAQYEYNPDYSISEYLFNAGITAYSSQSLEYELVRDGKTIPSAKLEVGTRPRPGDKVILKRNSMEVTRDYFTLVASLAGIIISSATLYYTVSRQ